MNNSYEVNHQQFCTILANITEDHQGNRLDDDELFQPTF